MINQICKFFAVCYCLCAMAQALPSGQSAHSGHAGPTGPSGPAHPLETIPMLSDFANIEFPKFELLDLGSTQEYVPEKEIKVIRTIKITKPYPVQVPVKVPYPVPVAHPVPVEVTKVVNHQQSAIVDIVKSIPGHVHSSDSSDAGGGGNNGEHPSAPAHVEQQEQWSHPVSEGGQHSELSHFSSEGHGDDSGNYAAIIAKHAAEYQQNYHQSEGDNYEVNEGHH